MTTPIRTLLQRIYRHQELDADTAADGVESLEKIREKEYAIAVVDLMMPRLNGYELVAQLDDAIRRPTVTSSRRCPRHTSAVSTSGSCIRSFGSRSTSRQ